MHKIKAISFDLDDTLWDCDSVIHQAEKSLLNWLHTNVPELRELNFNDYTQIKVAFNTANSHLWSDVSVMRKELLKGLLAQYGASSQLLQPAFDHFYQKRSEVVFYPDVLKSLELLAQHYKLASLSNGNADLHQIGIAGLFSEIHFATLNCPAKPAPDMFQRTCDALDIEPYELLHVGDNPDTDVNGGRLSGAKTIWINRSQMSWPENFQQADHQISDLVQLLNLLPLTSA